MLGFALSYSPPVVVEVLPGPVVFDNGDDLAQAGRAEREDVAPTLEQLAANLRGADGCVVQIRLRARINRRRKQPSCVLGDTLRDFASIDSMNDLPQSFGHEQADLAAAGIDTWPDLRDLSDLELSRPAAPVAPQPATCIASRHGVLVCDPELAPQDALC